MKQKLVLLLACFVLSAGLAVAQQRVTGSVVDSQGEPVVGATVRIEGTKIVTLTDANGNYTLQNVPASAKRMSVSYIGMETQTVPVGTSKVTMKENTLGETVVIGYGTAKRAAFTGSAAEIKGEDIAVRVTSNVSNAIAGLAPGVQAIQTSGAPGSGSTIRIRGFGSMNASSNPLIIVDDVPYDGSLASINPQDIATLTLEKDAAATAIYGARASNGVIHITTKKGRSQDAVVTFDAKWGSNHRAVPNYNVMTSAPLYYETAYRALYNNQVNLGRSAAEAHAFAQENLVGSSIGVGYQVYRVPDGQNLVGTNFKFNPAAQLGYSDGEYYYTTDDWYDYFFGKGNLRQEYNLNISGASDRLNYFVSASLLNDNGVVENSGYKRYSGRANVDYQAKKWLKVGSNMSFVQGQYANYTGSTASNGAGIFNVVNNIAPIYPIFVRDAMGNIMMASNGTPIFDNGASNTNFQRPSSGYGNQRPGAIVLNDRSNTTATTFNGKWYATLTPVKGLSLTASIAAMEYNARQNDLSSPWGSGDLVTDGGVTVSHSRTATVNNQYLANYTTTINELHNLTVLLGYEQYRTKTQGLSAYNDHLYNPFIGEINNAHGIDRRDLASSTDNLMRMGAFARAMYDYRGKYFVMGSVRRDASSRFYKDNRWGTFGGFGLGWLMSGERFMQGASRWIDNLKLKASWGALGNENLPYNQMYMNVYGVTWDATNGYATTISRYGNKDLTWETSYTWNIGADFSLFGGRLYGSLEWYNKKTVDLLFSLPRAQSAGGGNQYINLGSMRNRGVELELTGVAVKTKNVEWSITANLSHNKNTILELPDAVKANQYHGIYSQGSAYIRREGGSMYEGFYNKWAGVDPETGKSMWWKKITEPVLDAEGNQVYDDLGVAVTRVVREEKTTDYTQASYYDTGDMLPKLNGGLSTSLSLYGFDFSLALGYQLGGKIYDTGYQRLMHSGKNIGQNWHNDILRAWTPDNRYTDVPRLDANDDIVKNTSTRFLVSSNYLSFNNVTLGYTLPKNLTERIGIKALRLYVTGDNLGVISKRKGLDPRFDFGGGGAEYSATNSSLTNNSGYSLMRNISGGVTLTF